MKNAMLNKAKTILPSYEIKTIDGSKCLYKKFQGCYDVEIDGIRNRYDVYVWENTRRNVFQIQDIKLDDLKRVIEFIESMYKYNGIELKVIDKENRI